MKKLKFYQFVLALVAAVLVSAAGSDISTAYAAPAASATHLNNAVEAQTDLVQRRHRHWRGHRHRRNYGPAIALGIFGAAAAAAAAQNRYYYDDPYYAAPRQRCFVQTDPYGRGYWAWC
jgi:hypothetical protein